MMKPDTPKFALVPIEPTEEMLTIGLNEYHDSFGSPLTRIENAYKAMLAAAPKPDCVGVEEIRHADYLDLAIFEQQAIVDLFPLREERTYYEKCRTALLDAAKAYKLLAVKEKAQRNSSGAVGVPVDLNAPFTEGCSRIKRIRLADGDTAHRTDANEKAQERGEHPCNWQDEENKGGRS